MFLKNQWYCAALSHEMNDAPLGRILVNEPVVMYRRADGKVVALEDRCCHRRAPLSKGKIEGDRLRCGYHGFLYDATGKVVWVPGQDKVPPDAKVRAYPLVELHGWVWIWMGDPALADPKKVPDFHWYDDPAWCSFSGLMPVKSGYLLLVDNLLDMSHLAFLHAGTIGGAGHEKATLTWERQSDTVRGVRSLTDLAPSPRQREDGVDFNTDRTQVMTFTPPANVVIEITTTETGKKPGDPTSRHEAKIVILDSMTPETETSCHYFWASCRNFALDDEKFTEIARRGTIVTFTEDTDMLAAEQCIIDLAPGAPQVDVIGDHGGLQARRIVERLLTEERGALQAAE